MTQRRTLFSLSAAVRTDHLAWAWHTQQPRCLEREYWGQWWSHQLQGCCEDVLRGWEQFTHEATSPLLQRFSSSVWDGQKTELTHNKLADVLPFDVASWLVYNGHSDSPLQALWLWSEQKTVLSPSVPRRYSKYPRCSVKMTHLVQEERAVTRHPSSVVHDRRDVADKTNAGFTDLVMCWLLPEFGERWRGILTPHWPPARRSQRIPWDHICCDRGRPVGGS